jgi:hypothetical protein
VVLFLHVALFRTDELLSRWMYRFVTAIRMNVLLTHQITRLALIAALDALSNCHTDESMSFILVEWTCFSPVCSEWTSFVLVTDSFITRQHREGPASYSGLTSGLLTLCVKRTSYALGTDERPSF